MDRLPRGPVGGRRLATRMAPPHRGWFDRLWDRKSEEHEVIGLGLISGSIGLVAGILISFAVRGPIDDNAKDVLVAGLGGGLGLLTGLSVAFLGFRNARAIAKEQNKREDRYRFAADKQAAYSRLLSTGDVARTATESAANDPTQRKIDRAAEQIDQLTADQEVAALLGSSTVDDAAIDYVDALLSYYNLMIEISDMTPARRDKAMAPGSTWEKLHEGVLDRRAVALRAMRSDLELVRPTIRRRP